MAEIMRAGEKSTGKAEQGWSVPRLKKVSLTDITAASLNPGNDGVTGHTGS